MYNQIQWGNLWSYFLVCNSCFENIRTSFIHFLIFDAEKLLIKFGLNARTGDIRNTEDIGFFDDQLRLQIW